MGNDAYMKNRAFNDAILAKAKPAAEGQMTEQGEYFGKNGQGIDVYGNGNSSNIIDSNVNKAYGAWLANSNNAKKYYAATGSTSPTEKAKGNRVTPRQAGGGTDTGSPYITFNTPHSTGKETPAEIYERYYGTKPPKAFDEERIKIANREYEERNPEAKVDTIGQGKEWEDILGTGEETPAKPRAGTSDYDYEQRYARDLMSHDNDLRAIVDDNPLDYEYLAWIRNHPDLFNPSSENAVSPSKPPVSNDAAERYKAAHGGLTPEEVGHREAQARTYGVYANLVRNGTWTPEKFEEETGLDYNQFVKYSGINTGKTSRIETENDKKAGGYKPSAEEELQATYEANTQNVIPPNPYRDQSEYGYRYSPYSPYESGQPRTPAIDSTTRYSKPAEEEINAAYDEYLAQSSGGMSARKAGQIQTGLDTTSFNQPQAEPYPYSPNTGMNPYKAAELTTRTDKTNGLPSGEYQKYLEELQAHEDFRNRQNELANGAMPTPEELSRQGIASGMQADPYKEGFPYYWPVTSLRAGGYATPETTRGGTQAQEEWTQNNQAWAGVHVAEPDETMAETFTRWLREDTQNSEGRRGIWSPEEYAAIVAKNVGGEMGKQYAEWLETRKASVDLMNRENSSRFSPQAFTNRTDEDINRRFAGLYGNG